jgi:hypothetical protein
MILIITLFAILIILVLAGAAVLAVLRSQQKRYARNFTLAVQNTGNVRSRYELQSNDPAGAFTFNFLLNGAALGPTQGAVPKLSSSSSSSGTASARNTVAAASNKMQAARYQSGQVTQTIGGILSEIGYLIPGPLGQSLRNLSNSVRGVDNSIQRVQLQAGRATRLATIATDTADSVGRVTGAGQDKGHAQSAQTAPQADDRILTPIIEPGAQVQVQLLVAPADPRNARSTSFTVLSRSTETDNAEVMMQQGVIDYSNLSNTRYYLLYGLIAVATLAALWVVLVGLPAWGLLASPWGW